MSSGMGRLGLLGRLDGRRMVWCVFQVFSPPCTNLNIPQIFARKELNFERMSERDRKQIVAEVYVVPASSWYPRFTSPFGGEGVVGV